MFEVKQIAVDKFVITLNDKDTDLVVRLAQKLDLDHTKVIQTFTMVGLAMFSGLFSMGEKPDDLS